MAPSKGHFSGLILRAKLNSRSCSQTCSSLGCHLGEWRTSPSTQQPKSNHTASPPCHLHTSSSSRSHPLNFAPALSPGLLRIIPPSPPPQAPHSLTLPAFLMASKALIMSYPVVNWAKPGFSEPSSHCPLSRVIWGKSCTLDLCSSCKTSYSFCNTSHSPRPPSLVHACL